VNGNSWTVTIMARDGAVVLPDEILERGYRAFDVEVVVPIDNTPGLKRGYEAPQIVLTPRIVALARGESTVVGVRQRIYLGRALARAGVSSKMLSSLPIDVRRVELELDETRNPAVYRVRVEPLIDYLRSNDDKSLEEYVRDLLATDGQLSSNDDKSLEEYVRDLLATDGQLSEEDEKVEDRVSDEGYDDMWTLKAGRRTWPKTLLRILGKTLRLLW